MFDAVIFDCDGVLVDSEVLAIKGEREALSDIGLEYTPEEFVQRFIGLHDTAFFAQLRKDYRIKFEADPGPDFEDNILAGRRKHKDGIMPIDGAAMALDETRSLIGAIGVASSSRSDFLHQKLTRCNLIERAAPHVYSADLVDNGKPAPDIFLYTADRLGVDPSRCLVLEDSINGVKAAVSAGMQVWAFEGGGHIFPSYTRTLVETGATRIAKDFSDFVGLLRSSVG
ncbi:MAG: HAD family phosphatase [Pseudomonadota bacterium]